METPKFFLLLLLPFLLLASPCHATDSEHCPDPPGNNGIATMIIDFIEKLRPIMTNGNATIGIPVLDPYGPLPSLRLDFNSEQLRLDMSLDEVLIRKISSFVICSLNLTVGLSQKFDVEVHIDELHANGKYNVDGIAMGIFPIYGNGDFNLVVDQAVMTVSAKISYNPLTDHAKMKDLHFDLDFQALKLEMECILGCGDMANLVNNVASELGKVIFDKLWDYIQPLLETNVLDAINALLKTINISDLLPTKEYARLPRPKNFLEHFGQRHEVRRQEGTRNLGNGNVLMDLVYFTVSKTIISSGLDPAPLPDQTLQFTENGVAKLYNAAMTGLGSIHRSGTSTIDRVGDWVFLYTNFALDNLKAQCTGKVEVYNVGPVVEMSASVSHISVYMMARRDAFGNIVDIDQFIITEFGNIDVEINGLGLLDYLLEPLSEAVANAFHDVIFSLLQTTVADLIKDELQESPWPQLH